MTPSPSEATTPRRASKKPLVVILLLAAAGIGVWLWNVRTVGGKSSGGAGAIIAIKTAAATKQSVPLTLSAVGNVVTYETVSIRSRIDSQVTGVHFKDGDEVKAGDLLFELDDKSLRAQAAQLEANIARDRAQLENAKHQYDRASALATKGFATKATTDDSTANVAVAQASLKASQAALDSVRVQLGYTRITAPISGRTGTINVTLGNNVKANDTQSMVTINQLKPIRVQASLPQQYFQSLRDAMAKGPVTVTVTKQNDTNASNAIGTGTLDYIDNAVDATTGTFATRAGFANDDERLLPGMFVNVSLTLGDEEALTIPEVAVQHGQAGDYVYVVQGDKALKREVKIARLQKEIAVIDHGLEPGETVATDGLLGLKDGATVKVSAVAVAAPATAGAAP